MPKHNLWIIKLGGSLIAANAFQPWLEELAQHTPNARFLIVTGGSDFANQVRLAQAHSQFSDDAAHQMALLAMAQSALLVQDLGGSQFRLVDTRDGFEELAAGEIGVFYPNESAKNINLSSNDNTSLITALIGDLPQNWQVTSDSISLRLAMYINAVGLIVVKSAPPPSATVEFTQLAEFGYIDKAFPEIAVECTCPVHFLSKEQTGRLEEIILNKADMEEAGK